MPVKAGRLRAAAIALLCAFLVVLPFTSSVALRNVTLTGAGLCTLAWMAAGGEDWRQRLPPARLWVPIACWSLWCIVSLAWSVDPAYSLSELRPGLLPTLGAFLLFFALTDAYTVLDRFALALGAGLGLLALGAIGQQVVTGDWDPNRWHGDVGTFSTHVVLALPMLVWLWLRSRGSSAMRAVIAVTGLATLLVTFWTDNRIVWLSLAAMAVSAAFFAIHSGAIHDRRRLAAIGFLVVSALGGILVMAIQHRHEVKHQPELQQDPRLAIWAYARERIAEAPWIGHGYGRGILRKPLGNADGTQSTPHWHGHNVLVNVALQGGVVGLALFLWMWIAIVRELARGLGAPPPHRWCAALGITLIAGFALKNMTDDFFVRHVALLAWSLLGALLGALRAANAPARA